MNRIICAIAVFALTANAAFLSAADVTENQWVRANADGSLSGRVIVPRNSSIVGVGEANVSLVDQNGKVASGPVKSDNAGRFTLDGVRPGVYTLLVRGSDTFACAAMHVLDPSVSISNTFDIAAGQIDFSSVRGAMIRYLPPARSSHIEFDPMFNPLATDRALKNASVRVERFDGGLRGHLSRAGFSDPLGAPFSNVIVYQDGAEVTRTVSDENGDFVVPDLPAGSYTVLGSGREGFGLMGLELVDPVAADQSASVASNDDKTLVAQAEAGGNTFVMQVAPTPGAEIVMSSPGSDDDDLGGGVPLESSPQSYAGGGYSAGGGGAGGGAGGGGFGRIAVLGGIGAAIAIALSDDDDVSLPPTSSPSSPTTIIQGN